MLFYSLKHTLARSALPVLSTLVLIAIFSMIVQAQVEQPVIAIVGSGGIAVVSLNVTVLGSESVPCIGTCLAVLELRPEGLAYYVGNDSIVLISVAQEEPVNASLTYISQIALQADSYMEISLELPFDVVLVFPENLKVVTVAPKPLEELSLKAGEALAFDGGTRIQIKYVEVEERSITLTMHPEGTESPASTQPAGPIWGRLTSTLFLMILVALLVTISAIIVAKKR